MTEALSPQAGDACEAQLESLERLLLDPAARADAAELAALLHDDFIEFGRSGAVYDKAGTIAGLTAEASATPVARLAQDLKVKLLAEGVALVTYVSIRQAEGAAALRSRRSSIWTRAGGHWQMIFHQGTPIAAEATGG